MPPKKRTNNKKKKKGGGSGNAGIAVGHGGTQGAVPATANDRTATATVGPDERKFVEKGKLDFKRLAKNAPDLAQQLKDGAVEPDAAGKNMLDHYMSTYVSHPNQAALYLLQNFTSVLESLVAEAWPVTVHEDYRGMSKAERELFQDFAADIIRNKYEFVGREAMAGEIFDKTCVKFQQRLDKHYFDGEEGAFLSRCPLYRKANFYDHYIEKAIAILDADHPFIFAKHYMAVGGIKEGLDEVRSKCWECGYAPTKTKLLVCSACKAPHYCGKECQQAAWFGGHKDKCEHLKKWNKLLEASIDMVDRVHQSGHYKRVYTRPFTDFGAVRIITVPADIVTGTPLVPVPVGLDGPTMEYFYTNVAAIHGGKWWLFSHCSTQEEYTKAVKEADAEQGGEDSIHFGIIHPSLTQILCYDLEQAAQLKFSEVSTRTIEAVIAGFGAAQANDILGATMPREYFLSHFTVTSYRDSSELAGALRSLVKWSVLKEYRDNHHK